MLLLLFTTSPLQVMWSTGTTFKPQWLNVIGAIFFINHLFLQGLLAHPAVFHSHLYIIYKVLLTRRLQAFTRATKITLA